MKMTAAQTKALTIACKDAACCVYAGYNPGAGTVSAQAIAALVRRGLLEPVSTCEGETCARVTKAGAEYAEKEGLL